ncbi:hypothetical protein FB451DRAFT_1180477 [Mycena latifolia]|nr:hypothetical protein FB451DRAFT_1180477 [Mycena latifolia]
MARSGWLVFSLGLKHCSCVHGAHQSLELTLHRSPRTSSRCPAFIRAASTAARHAPLQVCVRVRVTSRSAPPAAGSSSRLCGDAPCDSTLPSLFSKGSILSPRRRCGRRASLLRLEEQAPTSHDAHTSFASERSMLPLRAPCHLPPSSSSAPSGPSLLRLGNRFRALTHDGGGAARLLRFALVQELFAESSQHASTGNFCLSFAVCALFSSQRRIANLSIPRPAQRQSDPAASTSWPRVHGVWTRRSLPPRKLPRSKLLDILPRNLAATRIFDLCSDNTSPSPWYGCELLARTMWLTCTVVQHLRSLWYVHERRLRAGYSPPRAACPSASPANPIPPRAPSAWQRQSAVSNPRLERTARLSRFVLIQLLKGSLRIVRLTAGRPLGVQPQHIRCYELWRDQDAGPARTSYSRLAEIRGIPRAPSSLRRARVVAGHAGASGWSEGLTRLGQLNAPIAAVRGNS